MFSSGLNSHYLKCSRIYETQCAVTLQKIIIPFVYKLKHYFLPKTSDLPSKIDKNFNTNINS